MCSDPSGEGKDNLLYQLNDFLRLRTQNGNKLGSVRDFLWFLMNGLEQLPPFRGTVYLGIPNDSIDIVLQHHSQGSTVYWSGFTSTSS